MSLPLFDREPERKGPRVLRVAELNRIAKLALEEQFADFWVEGELGDVTRPASGHVYFTLNDGEAPACIKGVMFRGDARRARAKLVEGERVRMRGGLTIYESRGVFQLVARVALPAGMGELRAELERLREKLAAEGLLDAARKRPLPRLPRVVGVVTSARSAAVHDIVQVAAARCPVRIVIAHCLVQGVEAPASICAALRRVQRVPGLDVVIVGRGGGSTEDLIAFNDERVARAIASCRVPTVSAVGHEVDVTIADLVADVRAATPSNAAELAVPDRRALVADLEGRVRALERALDVRIDRSRMKLERVSRRVADPRGALAAPRRRIASLTLGLQRAIERRVKVASAALESLDHRLARLDPMRKLARDRARLEKVIARLERRRSLVGERREQLAHLTTRLEALSPVAILARGYAIALHEPTGRALVRAGDAQPGDAVTVVLSRGRLRTRVEGRDEGSE